MVVVIYKLFYSIGLTAMQYFFVPRLFILIKKEKQRKLRSEHTHLQRTRKKKLMTRK